MQGNYELAWALFLIVIVISLLILAGLALGVIRIETKINHEIRLGTKTGPQPAHQEDAESEKKEEAEEESETEEKVKRFVGFFPAVMPPLNTQKEKAALRESFNEQERLIVSGEAATLKAFENTLSDETKVLYLATHIRKVPISKDSHQWRIYFSDGYFNVRQFADVLEAKLIDREEPLLLILSGCTSVEIADLLHSNLITVAVTEPVQDRHASDFGDKLIRRIKEDKLSQTIRLSVALASDSISDMVRTKGSQGWKEWRF